MSDVYPETPMGEPVTASRPATAAMTPGQAAAEVAAAMHDIARLTGYGAELDDALHERATTAAHPATPPAMTPGQAAAQAWQAGQPAAGRIVLPDDDYDRVPGLWDAVASAVASHLAAGFEAARAREGHEPAAMTPGQAAAEAFWRVAGEGASLSEDEWAQWARSGSRRPWDAAAQASITAGTGKILAELTTARRERDAWKAAHDSREAECTSLRRLRAEDLNKHRAELAARPVTLPHVHADSQEEAEAWMAAEYESVGDSHAMRDAYEAGWDRYRDLARQALEG